MDFVPVLSEEDKAYCRLRNISPDQYLVEKLFEFASDAVKNGRVIKLNWDSSVDYQPGRPKVTHFTINFDVF